MRIGSNEYILIIENNYNDERARNRNKVIGDAG